ncbi:uncharacterized protein LOC116182245 [Photinus pyralis]|uniref:uncharacterized protein LOC116182245 n=1 Tax=Photinus pyralis TaxID=7054 RepID=UPI0012677042|nr:uncharacterized protein LOC116182245 [Photinus pyralis]
MAHSKTTHTTIHGVPLVVTPRLHPLERLFWITTILLSATGAASLIVSNWQRYNANPTVVSIQKDFRNWNNLLPSATGCFKTKYSQELMDNYIEQAWGIMVNDTKYEYYAKFVKTVANVSYHSLDAFAKFASDKNLNKVNLLELAAKVHPKLTGTLVTYDPKRKTDWKLIMAEQGICFTVNNKFANVLTFNVEGVKVIDDDADETLLTCHYLNGLCYARYDSDPQSHISISMPEPGFEPKDS